MLIVVFGSTHLFPLGPQQGGGGAGGAGGDDRIVMEDSVFVSGLPDNVTESEIETFFGSIGVIKVRHFTHFVLVRSCLYLPLPFAD